MKKKEKKKKKIELVPSGKWSACPATDTFIDGKDDSFSLTVWVQLSLRVCVEHRG